jgi:hypothetical protein
MLATVVLVHVVAIGHVKVSTVYGIYSSIHPGYPKVNYRKLILYMWPHIVCNSVVVHTAVFSMDLAEPNYEKPQSINRTNL